MKAFLRFVPILLLQACDSFYVLQGHVTERETGSTIEKALISVYVLKDDHLWPDASLHDSFYSDSSGTFKMFDVISPTRVTSAAIVVSKRGYQSDTLYYRYSAADTIKIDAKLEKAQE